MRNALQIPTNQLEPNPQQPRSQIDQNSLLELVDSIREHGILEPLIVGKTPAGFQIIAGERRWRAARILKLEYVPAIVKEVDPRQMLEMAIVENLQRKDLNPIERARAFDKLKNEFGYDNNVVARRMGKSVPYIINVLKLLTLPDTLKDGLLSNLISEGHGRALSGIPDTRLMIEAYRIVIKEKASVRRAEEIARRMRQKIEDGVVNITKENLPLFLKSNLDDIGSDLQSICKNQNSKVRISQTNVLTKVTFQFRGTADDRFNELKNLYQQITSKELTKARLDSKDQTLK